MVFISIIMDSALVSFYVQNCNNTILREMKNLTVCRVHFSVIFQSFFSLIFILFSIVLLGQTLL